MILHESAQRKSHNGLSGLGAICFTVIVTSIIMATGCWKKPAAPAPVAAAGTTSTAQSDPAAIEANNRGVGLMGKFQYEEARAIFQTLVDRDPKWLDVKVNLAIATLNRQREGDEEAALKMLDEMLAVDGKHWRAHYCSGLLRLYLQSPEQALPHFKAVAEADANDAYAAYYVGQCLAQSRQYEEAVTWFEKAISLDSYLRSAYYAASQSYRALGRSEDATRMVETFQKLERNPRARLAEFKYKRMGPKSEAAVVDSGEKPQPMPKPEGPVFVDPVPLLTNGDQYKWTVRRADRPVSITACDINGDSYIDVFIANVLDNDGVFSAVCINNGDTPPTFTLEADHILAGIPEVNAALWGDYDNDGLTDVYLCRRGPNMLWRQSKKNVWEDVTAASGTANSEFDTVDGAMFDADHDGDLDIFCVNFDGPNELFNNNLDGPPITFRPIAQDRGIAGEGKGSIQVLPVDLDSDRDLDIIVLNKQPPHDVWINDRLWEYRPDEGAQAIRNQAIYAAMAVNVTSDNDVSIVLGRANGEVDLIVRDDSGAWQSTSRFGQQPELAQSVRWQVCTTDLDGDGHTEFIANRTDGLNLWTWSDWDEEFWPLDPINVDSCGWQLVNCDITSGPALVGIKSGKSPLIWRSGPGRYPFATLGFTGKKDNDTMRSNASGIGTHFAARMDSTWVTGSTLRNSSGPGQSLQPVAIGLGGHKQIDFISIDWSDGVFQSEVDLKAGEHHLITETQRQISSCPVLFAWDGTKYEFMTDALGVGGLGYMTAPGEYAPSRPWENLMLPPQSLQVKDGRFVLKLSEPMEEACYLDAARLVVYDLPPGWSMTLDERMNILGPEPTGEPRFYRESITPIEAINDRDENVTRAISTADLQAAPVGDVDQRFIGRLKSDHVLTLTFDKPIDSGEAANGLSRKRPMLIIDGWIEYPYSQTMFGAWQAGADYRAPSIEAMGADGKWQMVLEQFGYPAGMPRQMSVPLDNLPKGTKRLRITTNQEIYFDRIAVAWSQPMPEQAVRRELPLSEARLLQSGFAHRTTGPQRQPHYDYDRRSPYWDTRHQRGMYTNLGEMTDLIRQTDDALAIFGPGEEVHMEFNADLPDVPFTLGADVNGPGIGGRWTRVLVLELNGWCKDMDLFTKDGETIEPLPQSSNTSAADAAKRDQLHRRFNTRYESGR